MAQLAVEMTADEQKLFKGMQRVIRQQKRLEEGYSSIERKGAKATRTLERRSDSLRSSLARTFDPKQITAFAAGFFAPTGIIAGFTAVVNRINQAEQAIARFGSRSATAFEAARSFVTIQTPGQETARVQDALRIMREAGVTDVAGGFNLIQAAQSGFGAQVGDRQARAALLSTRLGIPIDLAGEMVTLAQGAGLLPEDLIRNVAIAGNISTRTPADIARAAPALSRFAGQERTGIAVAAALAGTTTPERLRTLVESVGIGTGELSPLARRVRGEPSVFEQIGAGRTQLSRLEALARAGIDTPAELAAAGLTEKTQQEAVAGAIRNLQTLQTALEAFAGAERDFIQREVARIEGAVPGIGGAAALRRAESERAIAETLGPRAAARLEATRLREIRGRVAGELFGPETLTGLLPGFGGEPSGIASAIWRQVIGAGIGGLIGPNIPGGAQLGALPFQFQEARFRAGVEEATGEPGLGTKSLEVLEQILDVLRLGQRTATPAAAGVTASPEEASR